MRAGLARSRGRRDLECLADGAHRPELDLAVTRHGGDALRLRAADHPDAVTAALADQLCAVLAQVTLQRGALHAAIVNSTESLSPSSATSGGEPNRYARTSRSASITFSRASSRVLPWLT